MTNPTPLSPAAQDVLQAFDYARDREYIAGEWVVNERPMLAAALRAAAQHLYHDWSAFNCIDALCEIADELEGQGQLTKESDYYYSFRSEY